VFTGSQDQTIRVWGVQKTAPCAHVIRAHDGPVMGLSLHATGDYLLSCSSDAVSMLGFLLYDVFVTGTSF